MAMKATARAIPIPRPTVKMRLLTMAADLASMRFRRFGALFVQVSGCEPFRLVRTRSLELPSDRG